MLQKIKKHWKIWLFISANKLSDCWKLLEVLRLSGKRKHCNEWQNYDLSCIAEVVDRWATNPLVPEKEISLQKYFMNRSPVSWYKETHHFLIRLLGNKRQLWGLEHKASTTNYWFTVIVSEMQDISQGLIDQLGRIDVLRV